MVATYLTTWKVLFCALLFFAADMVKVILAKIVAGHFHNQLHFSKMEDALNKVHIARTSPFSHCLCTKVPPLNPL